MNWLEYIAFNLFRLFRKMQLRKLIPIGISSGKFTEYFKGFKNVEAVKGIFGEETERVLDNLKIEFIGFGGYMGVDDATGNLLVNAQYLSKGDRIDIYLDVIHELCHIKQFMEGKELFDKRHAYVDRPTEIEAYRYTVKEAKRLGLSNERICSYLKTEWMSDGDLERLAKTLGINC